MDKNPGSKVLTTKTERMTPAVSYKSDGGPNGSSRSYPKGKGHTVPPWNPQKIAGNTYGLKGV